MDIISYGIASKAAKQEQFTRNDVLGIGVEGSYSNVKTRIDNLEKAIQGVVAQADKLIVNDAINIMKAHAKLNAVAKSMKYKMYNMIFDDLLDLSGIDTTKSSGYMHDAINGYIKASGANNYTIVTTPELTDVIPEKAILVVEENKTSKIDLSNGVGGKSGEKVYTAPNGVIVTSSAPVYTSSNVYYMEYLFNETYSSGNADTYWLTNSTGNQTLTFDFGSLGSIIINKIKVYPKTRTDASSNYRILVSNDNITYTEVVPWIINSTSDAYGTVREHNVSINQRYIRFELTKNGSWGVTLNEIEFFQQIDNNNNLGKYYISRDAGVTWEEIIPETLFYFNNNISPKDNKICLKAELPANVQLLNYALTWA